MKEQIVWEEIESGIFRTKIPNGWILKLHPNHETVPKSLQQIEDKEHLWLGNPAPMPVNRVIAEPDYLY